jgi:hypothetical protein
MHAFYLFYLCGNSDSTPFLLNINSFLHFPSICFFHRQLPSPFNYLLYQRQRSRIYSAARALNFCFLFSPNIYVCMIRLLTRDKNYNLLLSCLICLNYIFFFFTTSGIYIYIYMKTNENVISLTCVRARIYSVYSYFIDCYFLLYLKHKKSHKASHK